jgi:hypothetical protein
MRFHSPLLSFALFAAFTTTGCSDSDDDSGAPRVITTVTLTFTPADGGLPVVAVFNDMDGDGGAERTIDPVNLVKATTYVGTVKYENRLETPAEDINADLEDKSDRYQIFFTGTAVNGPASNQLGAPLTHAYKDMDANAIPIGLSNSFVTTTGSGSLAVTLRRFPSANSKDGKKISSDAVIWGDGDFRRVGGLTEHEIFYSVSVP